MKRMLTRFLMLSLILTLALSVTGVQEAKAAWVISVGQTGTTSGTRNDGYTYYANGIPRSSDTSVAVISSYWSDGNGAYQVVVRGISPGKATITWSWTAEYARYDSRLGYWITDTQYRSIAAEVTVEGCKSHNWSWKTVTAATTCTNGLERRTCTNTGCNETETRTIYAKHDYDDGVLTTNPTPESDGVLTYTCTLCGKTKTGNFSKDHAVHLIGDISAFEEKVGATSTVTVEATGDGLTYQWYVKDEGSSKFTKSSIKTDTYSVKMTAANTGRQIYCVVSDQYGNSLQTNTETLYSNKMITKQPEDASAYRDDEATVSVGVRDNAFNYKWYYKDTDMTKFARLKNESFETYSVVMNDKNNGRQVYCIVENLDGEFQQKTDIVTLTMLPDKPVYIRQQPVNVSGYEGEMLYGYTEGVNVVATGKDCTYRWYYKDAGMTKFAKSSVTTAWYNMTMTAKREGRQVYCVITDAYGNTVQSDTVTLSMKRAATIKTQPKDVAVNKGKTAKVTVKATGDGIKYTWYVKDTGSEEFVKSSIKTASYSVKMNEERNGRQVYCVITDKYGNSVTTNTVTMTMKNKIVIEQQPQSVTAVNNEPVSITVQATGEGLKYQWYYKDPGMSKFAKASVKTATYSVTMTEKRDGRQLYCKITDKYGLVVKTNTVTLTFNDTPIVITQQPQDSEYVGVGETVTATVKAEGAGLTYKWYYKNRDASKFSGSNQKTDTFTMTMDLAKSHREVYCKITDKYGNSIKTDTVKLCGPGVINIVKQPKGKSTLIGREHTFEVIAEGHDLTYTWYRRYYAYVVNHYYGTKEWVDSGWLEVKNHNDCRLEWSANGYTQEFYCVITDSTGYSKRTDTAYLHGN